MSDDFAPQAIAAAVEMTNDETRMTNECPMSKRKENGAMTQPEKRGRLTGEAFLRNSRFVIRSGFVMPISSLRIRSCPDHDLLPSPAPPPRTALTNHARPRQEIRQTRPLARRGASARSGRGRCTHPRAQLLDLRHRC